MRHPSVALAVLAAAACGDNTAAPPDAPPDGPTVIVGCGTVAGTIATYPGTFAGVTVGAGADLDVAEGACLDERLWFGDAGEDEVVELTNLTPGETYVIRLETDDDLTFWLTTACEAGGPADGACLLHVDENLFDEVAEFVAPSTGQVFVVVDASDGIPPETGVYDLTVTPAECTDDPECTDPALPYCFRFHCVECLTEFDCETAGAPQCVGHMCVGGPDMCTGDDGNEPDDGPAAATPIALPTATTPTVETGAVCSLPDDEADYYTFTLAAPRSLRFALTFTGADLDLYLFDATGTTIQRGIQTGELPEAFVAEDLPAGAYYVRVDQYTPMASAPATAYTLRVSVPECSGAFGCTTIAAPVCDIGECVAAPADCTGDDAGDAGSSDDGPVVARDVTGAVGTPVTRSAAGCNTPAAEADWYSVDVTAGQGLVVSTSFAAGVDFDVSAFDASGRILGVTFYANPEVVTLTYLPAGTVYVRVLRFADPAVTAAEPYMVTFTRTAAQTCSTRADCDDAFATQVYRGACVGGACEFVPPGARALGMPCDSGDDCDSAACSYIRFEADAADSVCTMACADTAGCASLPGTTCTTGFVTNYCVPSCADDLECGANVGSDELDAGQPWDYFVCTEATGICSPT